MSRYLLSIGSNCPDCEGHMESANRWLLKNFTDVVTSGVYSSAAFNGTSPDYLNMVALGSSPLPVTEVTALGKDFERACGRTPASKDCGCVEMDIDIIAVDRTILRPEEFTRAYFCRGYGLLPKD